jgi:hypothetical protein
VLLDAANELDIAYGVFFLLLPLLIFAVIVLSLYAIALARYIAGRRWRRLVSLVLGPPVACFLILLLFRAGARA